MTDGARTSIGLKKVAVKSTLPQVITIIVFVEVNLKRVSTLHHYVPNRTYEPGGTYSHGFLNGRGVILTVSQPIEQIAVHSEKPCPCKFLTPAPAD